ncbi:hypothetical protein BGZ80_008640 [Entomortierella chlamydospora]|uniref:Uncharacterized protein n=1 Tax=Entomortierella chlamydospora TaxID=101097 RepID=A0A9P6T128_9FUNG|nr:hypothetical protein BGZ79_004738 [Entomortierella chlamydospora]KAG0017070.1 hypothetical protein BGZ80_008640 [Entomortierella chlamydospora]
MIRLTRNLGRIPHITPDPGVPQDFQDEENFVAIFLQPFVFQGQDDEGLVVNALEQNAIQGQDQPEAQDDEKLVVIALQQLAIQGQDQLKDQDESPQEPPQNIPDFGID